jgi:hypothetical protein
MAGIKKQNLQQFSPSMTGSLFMHHLIENSILFSMVHRVSPGHTWYFHISRLNVVTVWKMAGIEKTEFPRFRSKHDRETICTSFDRQFNSLFNGTSRLSRSYFLISQFSLERCHSVKNGWNWKTKAAPIQSEYDRETIYTSFDREFHSLFNGTSRLSRSYFLISHFSFERCNIIKMATNETTKFARIRSKHDRETIRTSFDRQFNSLSNGRWVLSRLYLVISQFSVERS